MRIPTNVAVAGGACDLPEADAGWRQGAGRIFLCSTRALARAKLGVLLAASAVVLSSCDNPVRTPSLTEDQKILAAADFIAAERQSVVVHGTIGSETRISAHEQIPYADGADLPRESPGCCTIGPPLAETPSPICFGLADNKCDRPLSRAVHRSERSAQ